jgi:acyl-CoA synthetase (AMP-forming)/AMP-acid ligase II
LLTLGDQRDGTLLEAAAPFGDSHRTARRASDDLAAILYTSGTTGRSKGAMLSHRNLASNALTLDEFWGFKAERDVGRADVLLHALPLFHVHGLFVASHAALLAGAKTLMLPRFDLRQVLERLPRSTVMTYRPLRACLPNRRSAAITAVRCDCSSPVRRRCSPRRMCSSRSARATASSSVTACQRR